MAKDFDSMEDSNRSANPSIHEVSDPARRVFLLGGIGALAVGALSPWLAGRAFAAGRGPLLGFQPVPVSEADLVLVPEGYEAVPIAAWGEPVGVPGNMPAFRWDASNSAADQAAQMGMHHDGIHYYPIDGSSTRGLLVMNHEYTDDGLLFPDGKSNWTAEKVAKAQAAHGVAVIEVELRDGRWEMVRPSKYARRYTARTPFKVSGPAAGHALLQTEADPDGRTVLGTLNNCGSGMTPWGTYLSAEENWAFYFDGPAERGADQRRWGLLRTGLSRWGEHDPRFDAGRHPNEFHRFGWIVEIDPFDPAAMPVKRTALGRGAKEGAWVATTRDGRAVVYSGEDARFEYIYKFVSRDRIAPGGARANATLLDHGTLYVARFDADGTGRWLPLVQGEGPLTADNGFADQGAVLVRSRQASDLLGATKMDRPEWIAIDQGGRTVYCTLTNNSRRGAPGRPGVDAANPRANNTMGHIIQWTEDEDFDATTFSWRHLLLAGDPDNERPEARGNIRGDSFACPDGLAMDTRGVLWIQTDITSDEKGRGEFQGLGNNQMLACDPATGEVRRFLTGPVGCEITGLTLTPDGSTMFVNIQHPGEPLTPREDNLEVPNLHSNPADPRKYSNWPDFRPDGRPRSATVAIRKLDGGPIGT
ncbi:PhoX family phosphatase [Thioalkalivibrio sp. XN8]|uniref:PhoX family protein n=1 Tax=Thioalkalivibrio sp. XN8 TaxID=2712863 RepID=UPI0013ED3A40|nr:PhoX family phosphatase [Thioalkalivibrio sp. XN8]NGP53157.1 PhoX family phosphatase [Thioalkalivibrio sp. XN8]